MTPYPHLFTPIKIGGQLIKNRIFSAPTGLMSYTAGAISRPRIWPTMS